MQITEHRLLSFDGSPLFYRRVSPEGPLTASTLIVHGMGEHGGRYLELAAALAGAGIESWTADLRGFGQSSGRRGDVRCLDDFSRDLEVLYGLLARTAVERPAFIIGHSLGAFLSCRLIAESAQVRPKGVILTSPLIRAVVSVPAWKKALARLMALAWPTYTQKVPIHPADLTHDKTVLKRDASDPWIHFRLTARFFVHLERALLGAYSLAPKIRCPILVLQSGDDRIVSQEAGEVFFQRLASADKELVVYPGLFHEILNETARSPIHAKVISWIISRSK